MLDHVNGIAFGVFLFLFLLVTVLGFANVHMSPLCGTMIAEKSNIVDRLPICDYALNSLSSFTQNYHGVGTRLPPLVAKHAVLWRAEMKAVTCM